MILGYSYTYLVSLLCQNYPRKRDDNLGGLYINFRSIVRLISFLSIFLVCKIAIVFHRSATQYQIRILRALFQEFPEMGLMGLIGFILKSAGWYS